MTPHKFANDSKEQREWDKMLLAGWKCDAPMVNLQAMIIRDFGEQENILSGIRRCPIYGPNKLFTRRFIAAFLPKLSEKLWNGESDADILFWLYMRGEKINTRKREIDYSKAQRDRQEVATSLRRVIAGNLVKAKRGVEYDALLRSNQWNVVK